MQLYIQQLIEDLEQAADNLPARPYFESPPHLADNPDITELALVPYKTISEWTGIDSVIFPEMIRLSAGQCKKVSDAIFRVFQAFHIELVDIPDDIPPEILYDALITNWDCYVQYLPLSGFDLELCSGDPETCPYEDYCDCGETPDITEDEAPPYSEEDFEGELPF